MRLLKKITIPLLLALLMAFVGTVNSGCGVYSFRDVSIPDSIRTIRIQKFDNVAPYVNPQLAPNLSERLRRKVQNQTRLSLTNDDRADYDVAATVTDYSVTTSAVGNNSTSTLNRLTVTVRMSLTNNRTANAVPQEQTVSRSFDFSATQSLQQAEAALLDQMLNGLADDIFNRLFSNW
ncbi:MAG: hypothetical protein EOO16_20525 [Chitinophagaceae bacterium]|nr:MAG: hypothetical protein EOO16_20525 [Chitinophagaceae bacterium]